MIPKNFDIAKLSFDYEKEGCPLLKLYLTWLWVPAWSGGVGFFSLRAISLTKEHARYAKESAKRENERCKVHVEETFAEHLFGNSMFNRASGEEPPNGWEGVNLDEEENGI